MVDRIVLRGTIAVRELTLTDPPGKTMSVFPETDGSRSASGWTVTEGEGTVTVQPMAEGEPPALLLKEALPEHKENESHSVIIHEPRGNLLFAAGTIQWSWALDEFGYHKGNAGNVTPVDRRVQLLTRNILRALSGKV